MDKKIEQTRNPLHSKTPKAPLPEWAVGISPADIITALNREIEKVLKQAKGNQLRALKLGFERQLNAGLITPNDYKRLNQTFLTVYAAEEGKRTPKQVAEELELIYHESLMDADSSDAANAVIGVAYSKKEDMAIGGLLGMGIGMVIGGALSGTGPFGGSAGAQIGAIVGTIVGSWAAGVCEANN
ncbi:hypothetical protein [Pseudozobellia thermophila]|uniref:Glycine zipper n=1 Tax=Pseudozobellia thermophila TaxID=192903 RepID=A0A1M6JNC6_9FLAO|nr:hypothetical protein [Pseudozobellia thermophila]SHJ48162.1 hypothetical protein SAMN04488513_10589 [Pseudozobellia thermophila]